MKICFVLEHFYPHVGGVEIVFWEYAKNFVKLGHEVKVITSNSANIIGKRNIEGINVFYFECVSFFGHPLLKKTDISEHIKWADIVHTTTYTAALPTIKICKKYKKPCLITVHEVLGKKWFLIEKNPLKALAFYFFESFVVNKKYTLWHVISQATMKDLCKFPINRQKIFLLYHGINNEFWNDKVIAKDLSKYLEFEKENKIFLYTGRPGKTKGVFLLLKAIHEIEKSIPKNFKFGLILSNEPKKERMAIEKYILNNKLYDLIHIKDPLPYELLPGYRKAAYAGLIPSITEGFGFSAAEFSALGVPLISSDGGSLPEVSSGKVLFFQNNDYHDLASKLSLAMENNFLQAPKKIFDWNKSTNELIKRYQEIL